MMQKKREHVKQKFYGTYRYRLQVNQEGQKRNPISDFEWRQSLLDEVFESPAK